MDIQKISKMKNNHSEDAYNKILGGIMDGTLKPGMIVSEHDLSSLCGLGRTPVREAMKRLEGEGFIINSDRKKRIYELTQEDIKEIFDLKVVIEGFIAAKAAECRDDKKRDRMAEIIRRIESIMSQVDNSSTIVSEENKREWLALDAEFHSQLYAMADNSRAKIIIDNLNIQWHKIRAGLNAITTHLDVSLKEHLNIANAVMDNDPEKASSAIISHFRSLCDRIVSLMNTFVN